VLSFYRDTISNDGKAGLFWLLVGFLLAFVITRVIVRNIRRGSRFAPKNVTVGSVHIHHVVFGVILMVVSGVVGFTTTPPTPWLEILAASFGVGAALTMDEFALLLHLDDVYWSEEGRWSIDAVILTTALLALLLLGVVPLRSDGIDTSNDVAGRIAGASIIALNVVLVTFTALKGKLITALLGMFVPFVSVFGASRLARPGSPWARVLYRSRPHKLERARARFAAADRRRNRIYDFIGGAPSSEPDG
jgi:lysyl-tRNA synthetase, class II